MKPTIESALLGVEYQLGITECRCGSAHPIGTCEKCNYENIKLVLLEAQHTSAKLNRLLAAAKKMSDILVDPTGRVTRDEQKALDKAIWEAEKP